MSIHYLHDTAPSFFSAGGYKKIETNINEELERRLRLVTSIQEPIRVPDILGIDQVERKTAVHEGAIQNSHLVGNLFLSVEGI